MHECGNAIMNEWKKGQNAYPNEKNELEFGNLFTDAMLCVSTQNAKL